MWVYIGVSSHSIIGLKPTPPLILHQELCEQELHQSGNQLEHKPPGTAQRHPQELHCRRISILEVLVEGESSFLKPKLYLWELRLFFMSFSCSSDSYKPNQKNCFEERNQTENKGEGT